MKKIKNQLIVLCLILAFVILTAGNAVAGFKPSANFTYSRNASYPSAPVFFTDTSTGSPTEWSWDFGDGTYSNVQYPQHVYTSAGNYLVTLKVSSSGGSDRIKKSISIF